MSAGRGFVGAEMPPVEVRVAGRGEVYRARDAALLLALVGLLPEVGRHRLAQVVLDVNATRVVPSLRITLPGPGPNWAGPAR